MRLEKKQGHFIEVQVTDGALYRTKIHCYFLDQTRVVRPLAQEKNYHIFYQMLAGLTPEERSRLSLEGYSVHNLRYLNRGDTRCNEAEVARRFAAWKSCLGEWTRGPLASRRGSVQSGRMFGFCWKIGSKAVHSEICDSHLRALNVASRAVELC